MSTLSSSNYGELLVEIKQRIRSAQYEHSEQLTRTDCSVLPMEQVAKLLEEWSDCETRNQAQNYQMQRCSCRRSPSLHHFGEPFSLGSAFIGTIRARSPTSFGIEPNKLSLPRATECDRSACITRTQIKLPF